MRVVFHACVPCMRMVLPFVAPLLILEHVLVFVLGLAFGVQIRDPEVERLNLQVRISFIPSWKCFIIFIVFMLEF